MRGGIVAALVAALALASTLSTGAAPFRAAVLTDDRRVAEPRPFRRPARAGDALPRSFRFPGPPITASRRVATHVDARGHTAVLYAAKRGATQTCLFLIRETIAAGGCSAPASFVRPGHVAAIEGRLFAGLAADDVARVVVVRSRGVRRSVELTADGGFIYDCRVSGGCACVVDAVETYARDGTLLSRQRWLPASCAGERARE